MSEPSGQNALRDAHKRGLLEGIVRASRAVNRMVRPGAGRDRSEALRDAVRELEREWLRAEMENAGG
jgi:hypothetical protein